MTRSRLAWGAVACLLAASAPQAAELRVSVAVSFKPVAESLLQSTLDPPEILWNSGASSILAQQVLRGAPADLIITAGAQEMDRLEAAGSLLPGSRTVLAGNRLVVAVPAASSSRILTPTQDRWDVLTAPSVQRIAVGNPRTAPLGRYTADLLRRADLAGTLAPRLIFAENARIALEYVARGDVDAGIVYATDIELAAGRVRAIDLFPPALQPEIVFEAAVVRRSSRPAAAQALLALLASAQSALELQRQGWLAPR